MFSDKEEEERNNGNMKWLHPVPCLYKFKHVPRAIDGKEKNI